MQYWNSKLQNYYQKKMEFKDILAGYDWEEVSQSIAHKTLADVDRALSKRRLDFDDLLALLAPVAQQRLEVMAQLSRSHTQRRFGKTIQLYIPLYLSNACTNHCIYCGFNHENKIKRVILTEEEIEKEVLAIREMGNFQHILLVTGESPRHCGTAYLKKAIEIVRKHFANVSIEVQPMDQADYEELIAAGLNSVYVYQETYHKERYRIYHPAGKKRDYDYRLDTCERLGRAGIRKMGLGVLVGLENWRTDMAYMALHLRYLQKKYWRTKYSISFPRIRPHEGEGFKPNVVMSDKELAQAIFAFRIYDNDTEIALSTREAPEMRNNMCSLGVTSMSAGSKTEPGGYACYPESLEQWTMADDRSPAEVVEAINKQGYEAVWKDWDDVMN